MTLNLHLELLSLASNFQEPTGLWYNSISSLASLRVWQRALVQNLFGVCFETVLKNLFNFFQKGIFIFTLWNSFGSSSEHISIVNFFSLTDARREARKAFLALSEDARTNPADPESFKSDTENVMEMPTNVDAKSSQSTPVSIF